MTGSADHTLRVWDVLSGKQVQQTPTVDGAICCAAALRGNRVATGHTRTGEIRLWSLRDSGGSAGVLQGHTYSVYSLAVVGGTAQHELLASGCGDYSVRLWDVDAGTCTAVLNGHTNWVKCLADLGGGRLLSGSWDKSLRVWNTATGVCLAGVPNAHGAGGTRGFILSACALPGGAATVSLGGTVQRWKWDEGVNALTPDGAALQLEDAGVDSLASMPRPDGALQLLAGCYDGSLRVLGNGAGGELQQQAALAGHAREFMAVTVIMP